MKALKRLLIFTLSATLSLVVVVPARAQIPVYQTVADVKAVQDGLATVEKKQSAPAPASFENADALNKWAEKSTLGGGSLHDLNYKKHKLAVVFRCHTSGEATAEPFIFLERDGKWIRLYKGAVQYAEMETAIEEDSLVIWSLTWPDGKRTKTEWLRYELSLLK